MIADSNNFKRNLSGICLSSNMFLSAWYFIQPHEMRCSTAILPRLRISPTVCYSLDTCPLTNVLNSRLDVTQRVMLRRMVGWVSFTRDTWEERGRKMKR